MIRHEGKSCAKTHAPFKDSMLICVRLNLFGCQEYNFPHQRFYIRFFVGGELLETLNAYGDCLDIVKLRAFFQARKIFQNMSQQIVSLHLTYLVEFLFVTFPPQNGGSALGDDSCIDGLAISLHMFNSSKSSTWKRVDHSWNLYISILVSLGESSNFNDFC